MKKYYTTIFDEAKDIEIFVVIPAAGMGNRMKSYGPQSLIKINGETLIDRQISLIQGIFPKAKIAIISGFMSEKIMNSVPDSIMNLENPMYYNTNVIKSISVALRANQDCKNLLVVLGDLYFNSHAISKINLKRSSLTLSDVMSNEEVGCIVDANNNVSNLMYDLPKKWSQIAYFKGKELNLFKKYALSKNNNTKYMFESINYILENNGKMEGVYSPDIISYDIDTPKDLRYIREKYENSV